MTIYVRYVYKVRYALLVIDMDVHVQTRFVFCAFLCTLVASGERSLNVAPYVDVVTIMFKDGSNHRILSRVSVNREILFGVYDSDGKGSDLVHVPYSTLVSSILNYTRADVTDMKNEIRGIVYALNKTYAEILEKDLESLHISYTCTDFYGHTYAYMHVFKNGHEELKIVLRNGTIETIHYHLRQFAPMVYIQQLFARLFDGNMCPSWAMKVARSHKRWSGTLYIIMIMVYHLYTAYFNNAFFTGIPSSRVALYKTGNKIMLRCYVGGFYSSGPMTMYWYSSMNATTPMQSSCKHRLLSDGTHQHICDNEVRAENAHDWICKFECDSCNVSLTLSLNRDDVFTESVSYAKSTVAKYNEIVGVSNADIVTHVPMLYVFTYLLNV